MRRLIILVMVVLFCVHISYAVAPFVLLGSTALRFSASAGVRWVVNKWRADMTQSFIKSALVHATAGSALWLTYDNVVNNPPVGERYINVDMSAVKAPVKARADKHGYQASVDAVNGSSQSQASGWCSNLAMTAERISYNPSTWANQGQCGVVYDYYNNDYVCAPVGYQTTRGNFTTKRASDVWIGGVRADQYCASKYKNDGISAAADAAAAAIMGELNDLRDTMRDLVDAINSLNGTLSDSASADADNRRVIDGKDADVVSDNPGDGEVDEDLIASGGSGLTKSDIADAMRDALGQPSVSGDGSISAATDRPNNIYDTTFSEIPKDSISTKIQGWIGNNPLRSLIQGSAIQVSPGACSMSFDAFGSGAQLSFCELESYLSILGSIVLGIASLYAFFIAFGVRVG